MDTLNQRAGAETKSERPEMASDSPNCGDRKAIEQDRNDLAKRFHNLCK
jgi:hypothetical protein